MSNTNNTPSVPLGDRRPSELTDMIQSAMVSCSTLKTIDELVERGARRYRLVDTAALARQLSTTIEVLVLAFQKNLEASVARERDAIQYNVERSVTERRREIEFEATGRVLRSLLELVDVVEALVEALGEGGASSMAKALDRRIDAVLRTHGYQRIESVGRPFDPTFHECIEVANEGDASPGCVVREISRGYSNGSLVLRFAKVVVKKQGE